MLVTAPLRRIAREVIRRTGLRRSRGARTFEIAYAIVVSDDVHNHVTKLKLDILDRYGSNPGIEATPHITLKLGFPVEIDRIHLFEAYFDRVLTDVTPFSISVTGVDFFDEGIVFLDVAPSPQLDNLRRRIVTDLSTQYGIAPHRLEGDQYRFHVTAGYVPRRALPDARSEFRARARAFTFSLDTLAMLCHTGREWVTYKRARLTTALEQRP